MEGAGVQAYPVSSKTLILMESLNGKKKKIKEKKKENKGKHNRKKKKKSFIVWLY